MKKLLFGTAGIKNSFDVKKAVEIGV